ncbi:hypothetical protein PHLGIDRAFT_139205 [Phlebiopsis gigantea 11061_1 CR5-6]|uniref:Uncharacterized protein n=1 Tax=Phlebiopsis gigantea (strain 11061_1 CR5-6) TaxID=745531 RepID=A0A0C3SF02_PHLG1|nr:hypothetical protein PHLGIDRAFT_139205 [Phlebiopsis gigantea 11061_1 CR5-6]
MDTAKPTADTTTPAHDFHYTHRESSPRMFEPGIPMPVSADPTVPDPASVHSSPMDSPRGTSPQAEDQRGSFLHVRSAVPPALLQQLSRSSGISGLFTPYSQASSGPSSPAIADGSEGIDSAEEIAGGELTSEPVPTAPSTEIAAHGREHDVDLDADGDIDPDYEEAVQEPAVIQEDETGEHPPLAAEQVVEQPYTLAVGDPGSIVEVSVEEPSAKPSEENQPIPRELDQSQAEKTGDPGHPIAEPLPTPAASEVDPTAETVNATAEKFDADDVVLPLVPEPVRKRKRTSPPPTTRMTRSRSNNVIPPLIPVAVTRSAKSRGKQKVVEQEPDSNAPSDGEFVGEPSKQATPSEKGLSSVVVSRESSVVSNSTDAFTVMTPSSPITVTMERSSLAAAFQSDGFLRHHHGPLPHALPPPPPPPPPPFPPVTTAPKVIVTPVELPKPRSPSPSPVESVHEAPPAEDGSSEPPHTNGDTADEIPGTMAEPSPVDAPDAALASESELPADVPEAPPAEQITGSEVIPLSQAPSASTSPVTRSQCRFHKISIPVAENDPRMSFVVPGCSLSNRDVMHKQDIKDEGDLTYDEIHRLRADVPSLDINQDIVTKLALLVGGSVDKDAYYLPQPDERVRMRSNTRHPRLSNVENISARNGLSTRRGVRKTTPAASTSASASATASPAYSHLSALTNVDSVSDDESAASRPAPKRRRRVATAPAAVESSAAAGREPQTKTRTSRKVRANPAAPKEDLELPKPDVPENQPEAETAAKRRPGRRRIARDATAYKPEDDTKGDVSEAEAEKNKVGGKKTGTRPRGLKRSRTSEEAQAVEKPKRRKVKQ